ncbi:hypothetical protein [Parvibaculum sp.]|uniref:hypothetical protein n=2 Tax=Parvibaculum sp. TaxID=2024848 RepID=UPI001B1A9483|nr:hypothetical protein [Parvibaculum sp.]MBO6678268.1 hypothetical protein [Parvibaculum sp.]MBO6684516.1 hypothetical protein [Parvibaculum sp.]MBO6904577.1 hypothetical protein [Parvibaculum sp.]
MAKLFDEAAANGSSEPMPWQGGTGTFWVWGAFDGASVMLEASPDGENWFTVGESVQFSERGIAAFALGPCRLRATIANAGADTSISAVV